MLKDFPDRTTSQLRSHCQKYILKICKKYGFKVCNNIYSIKESKYLDNVNESKGDGLQSITTEEESFLRKFKYYKITSMPFKIIKYLNREKDCKHSDINRITFSRIKNKIFKIEKIKQGQPRTLLADNFFKNLEKTGSITNIKKDFSNMQFDNILRSDSTNLQFSNERFLLNTTKFKNSSELESKLDIKPIHMINQSTECIQLAIFYQMARFQNIINYNNSLRNYQLN